MAAELHIHPIFKAIDDQDLSNIQRLVEQEPACLGQEKYLLNFGGGYTDFLPVMYAIRKGYVEGFKYLYAKTKNSQQKVRIRDFVSVLTETEHLMNYLSFIKEMENPQKASEDFKQAKEDLATVTTQEETKSQTEQTLTLKETVLDFVTIMHHLLSNPRAYTRARVFKQSAFEYIKNLITISTPACLVNITTTRSNNTNTFIHMLCTNKFELELSSKEICQLIIHARNTHKETVLKCLNTFASYTLKEPRGEPSLVSNCLPIHLAVYYGHVELVQYLYISNWSQTTDINICDDNGFTCYDFTLSYLHHFTDPKARAAFDAPGSPHSTIARFLREMGATIFESDNVFKELSVLPFPQRLEEEHIAQQALFKRAAQSVQDANDPRYDDMDPNDFYDEMLQLGVPSEEICHIIDSSNENPISLKKTLKERRAKSPHAPSENLDQKVEVEAVTTDTERKRWEKFQETLEQVDPIKLNAIDTHKAFLWEYTQKLSRGYLECRLEEAATYNGTTRKTKETFTIGQSADAEQVELDFLDLTSRGDYRFMVHTTSEDPESLRKVLDPTQSFLSTTDFFSGSLVDKTTPPATMGHQDDHGKLLFPISLILDLDGGPQCILKAFNADIWSPSANTDNLDPDAADQAAIEVELKSHADEYLSRLKEETLKCNGLERQLEIALEQDLTQQEGRPRKPDLYMLARASDLLKYDGLRSTKGSQLTPDVLLKRTETKVTAKGCVNFYNELIIKGHPRTRVIGILVEKQALEAFKERLETDEEQKTIAEKLRMLANCGVPLVLVDTKSYIDDKYTTYDLIKTLYNQHQKMFDGIKTPLLLQYRAKQRKKISESLEPLSEPSALDSAIEQRIRAIHSTQDDIGFYVQEYLPQQPRPKKEKPLPR